MPRLKGLKIGGGSGEVMEISVDLEPTLYAIGAMQAFSRSLNDKVYIDALFDEAFEKADAAFDKHADAVARTGAISHMYEWGTVGVNKGRSNMRLAPENPKAKLWSNFSVGSGLNRSIAWVYRPSVATVPKPTSAETGMSAEVISLLRPQYFTWKAEVMEENRTVTISPQEAKFLLLPATKENRARFDGWRPNDLKRGYMLTQKTIESQPGKNAYYGSFTGIWDAFWLGEGSNIISEEIGRMVEQDYFPEVSRVRPPGKLIPAKAWNVRGNVQESANATKKRVTTKRRLAAQRAKKKRSARKAPR